MKEYQSLENEYKEEFEIWHELCQDESHGALRAEQVIKKLKESSRWNDNLGSYWTAMAVHAGNIEVLKRCIQENSEACAYEMIGIESPSMLRIAAQCGHEKVLNFIWNDPWGQKVLEGVLKNGKSIKDVWHDAASVLIACGHEDLFKTWMQKQWSFHGEKFSLEIDWNDHVFFKKALVNGKDKMALFLLEHNKTIHDGIYGSKYFFLKDKCIDLMVKKENKDFLNEFIRLGVNEEDTLRRVCNASDVIAFNNKTKMWQWLWSHPWVKNALKQNKDHSCHEVMKSHLKKALSECWEDVWHQKEVSLQERKLFFEAMHQTVKELNMDDQNWMLEGLRKAHDERSRDFDSDIEYWGQWIISHRLNVKSQEIEDWMERWNDFPSWKEACRAKMESLEIQAEIKNHEIHEIHEDMNMKTVEAKKIRL